MTLVPSGREPEKGNRFFPYDRTNWIRNREEIVRQTEQNVFPLRHIPNIMCVRVCCMTVNVENEEKGDPPTGRRKEKKSYCGRKRVTLDFESAPAVASNISPGKGKERKENFLF